MLQVRLQVQVQVPGYQRRTSPFTMPLSLPYLPASNTPNQVSIFTLTSFSCSPHFSDIISQHICPNSFYVPFYSEINKNIKAILFYDFPQRVFLVVISYHLTQGDRNYRRLSLEAYDVQIFAHQRYHWLSRIMCVCVAMCYIS